MVDAVQARLDKNPDAMRTRRETVEHPFGTLKMRMGATHFLMKTASATAPSFESRSSMKNWPMYLHAFSLADRWAPALKRFNVQLARSR